LENLKRTKYVVSAALFIIPLFIFTDLVFIEIETAGEPVIIDDYLTLIHYKVYPTPTEKNESCILNRTIWDLFEKINGFENTPTVISLLEESNDFITLVFNDTNGEMYIVNLSVEMIEDYGRILENEFNSTYVKIITLTCIGPEAKKCVVHIHIPGVVGDIYALTAYLDMNKTLHVFFLVTNQNVADVPHYYTLFHSKVDVPKNTIDKCKIFYFEKKGNYGPPPPLLRDKPYPPRFQEEKNAFKNRGLFLS